MTGLYSETLLKYLLVKSKYFFKRTQQKIMCFVALNRENIHIAHVYSPEEHLLKYAVQVCHKM